MQPEWQSFLETAGAVIDKNGVLRFSSTPDDPDLTNRNLLADLSHRGVIGVHGEDAATFLQGQLTNDVRKVDAAHSQLTGHCTPKGRLLALFRLLRHGDGYLLQLPQSLVAPMLKRLRMYVLRSKVTLDDAGDRLVRCGVAGPDAERLLGIALPNVDDAVQRDEITIVRVAGLTPRFELYGEAAPMQALWQSLSGRAQPVDAAVWELLGIRAGVPQVFPATSEAFVPQMLNLHAINGIGFTKGCYTGQEVVARVQYLGKLKRRMYLAHVDAGASPAPGDELVAATDGGQGTGTVVDAQPAPGGGYDLLAVINIANVENGDAVHLRNAAGPALHLRELPYHVDEFANERPVT